MRYFVRWLFVAALLLLCTVTEDASAQGCELTPRLEPDIRARVEPGPGTANNLRADPGLSADVLTQIRPGGVFRVISGPECADSYVWWQVEYDGVTGWTAEGDPVRGRYWLEPLTLPVDVALVEGDPTLLCQQPPDDYNIVEFDFARLNTRTVVMLDYATQVYHTLGGLLSFDFRDALVQGSYNPGVVEASFGTHDAGGAVDLSVREAGTWVILTDEIPLMLRALRIAGFAAWLRDTGELYPNSPIHIHAIAVGDAELSGAARAQIDGPFGYLRGYNGLPQESGIPLPDTSGDLIVCPWMVDLGFDDLRDSR